MTIDFEKMDLNECIPYFEDYEFFKYKVMYEQDFAYLTNFLKKGQLIFQNENSLIKYIDYKKEKFYERMSL